MSVHDASPLARLSSRRVFVRSSAAAAALGLLAGCQAPASAPPPPAAPPPTPPLVPLTKEARDALSPDQILDRAREGNLRFREGRLSTRDFVAEQQATAAGQHPAAVLLSCVDSRAPAEILLDLGLGDMFNCRVAGNIENPDILGSMEFATQLSGAKVALVMGHSACGAIKGAIADARLGNLTQLLAKLRPAIQATVYAGDRSDANPEFVDAVARTNVQLTIDRIRKSSPVMAALEKSGALKITGSFYDVATGEVTFA